jgi:hypothetical protein
MDIESVKLVLANAERLSAMADKVAGFAIASSLALIFYCFNKDIAPWVQRREYWFQGGVLIGNLIYIAAVWVLHCCEYRVSSGVTLTDSL